MLKKIIIKLNERKYQNVIKKNNHNLDFSLISNNCISGIIYHNLGLKFRSPTINLYIAGEDYLHFVKDIHYYLSHELIEQNDSDKDYPIGNIAGDDTHKSIAINFLHYKSFEVAKEKWEERSKRINWNNVFYVWEFYDNLYDIELIHEFDSLPINKMCIIHRDIPGIKNKCVIETGNVSGKLFEYDGLTGKRFLDRFDYIAFLNTLLS